MLLTTCPKCSAKFKVSPEQLNVRQGRVMCGRCRHVFNAFETLKRTEDNDAGEPIDYTLLDATQETDSAQQIPPLDTATAAESTDKPELSRDVHGVAGLPPDADLAITPDIDPAAEPDAQGLATTNPLIGGPVPADPVQSRVWVWLGTSAGVALALQAAFYFRSEIVQQYPQLRPQMAAMCEAFACSISWGRDTALIKIESSDLIEPPGRPGRILLTATLVNRAPTKQDFPALEVKLTDANNAVLSSRVLMPAEYLGRVPAAGEGLAPNIELYVNLNMELVGKPQASGYGLRAFYP